MTIFAEANVDVDLRMLRSFRVLRPLKLVSRIPSKRRCRCRQRSSLSINASETIACFFFLHSGQLLVLDKYGVSTDRSTNRLRVCSVAVASRRPALVEWELLPAVNCY